MNMAKKYIVLHGTVGPHQEGAIIDEKSLYADQSLDWWLKTGAVREATAEEAKQGDPGEEGSVARSVSESTGDMKVDERDFIEAHKDDEATVGTATPPATATDADKADAARAKGSK
jgi:hypothetical protein